MSYTNVFGGNTIYPSDVSFLALALTADAALEWPMENSGELPPAARIIDVTPDAAGRTVTLPDATQTGAGQTLLFNNLSGTYSFLVKDFQGNVLATVGFGEQWELYLAATTTTGGTWRVFRFGASTASVQPSSLAGYGLTVSGSTLSQATPVTTFSTSGISISSANRAATFVWNSTGAGTIYLPTAASVGNNFFVLMRNEGGGDLTIDPAGTELINGSSTLSLRPGDSATVITDGVRWYTVGLGQQAVFAFDYTSITVTGGNYSLSGSELNRIAYKFVGTLTADAYVIIPATVQQYWINNATTGSFDFFMKTSTGAAVRIAQGAKGIYYCDGVNLVLASDPTTLSTPITVPQGGTGAITASAARLNLGVTAFADPIVTATSGASVRTIISAAVSGANADITSITGLTTPLSVTQGGTGSTTQSGARANLGLGSMALQNSGAVDITGGTITGGTITGITDLAIADGGTGASTATDARANLGLASMAVQSSGAVSISGGTITGITDLAVADGGTGASTAAAARTNLGLGTISTQNSNAVSITGGSVTGITDLAVADGGTGASTAADARTNLGLGDVATQNASTGLTAISGPGNYSYRAQASATRPGTIQFVDPTGTIQRGNIYHDGNFNIYSDVGSILLQGLFPALISASSLVSNGGYFKLSNGLTLMWGSQFIGAGATTTVNYPLTMTSFSIVTVTGGTMADITRNGPFASATSTTGFTLNNNSSIGSTAFWIAVGV